MSQLQHFPRSYFPRSFSFSNFVLAVAFLGTAKVTLQPITSHLPTPKVEGLQPNVLAELAKAEAGLEIFPLPAPSIAKFLRVSSRPTACRSRNRTRTRGRSSRKEG
jgi:hypothetical protein